MSESKQQYLQSVRADSAYPVYRSVIGIFAFLGYLLAGTSALMTLVFGFGLMTDSFAMGMVALLMGGIVSAMVFFLAKLSKEAALILVDLADSTVEANSRSTR